MKVFKFIWKIENYNLVPIQRGKAICSPSFSVNFMGPIYLELYPQGDILDPKGESIILNIKDSSKLTNTSIECEVSLTYCDLVHSFNAEKLYSCTKWRFKRADKYSTNISTDRKLLTIKCKFAQTSEAVQYKPFVTADENDMELLAGDLVKIYISQQFNDVTLSVGKEKFKAHKAILFARLPKLIVDTKSNDYPTNIDVSDFDASVISHLLSYAYSGKLDSSTYDIPSGVNTAAQTYEITDLKRKLFSMPNILTARTCIKTDHRVFFWPIPDVLDMVDKRLFSPTFNSGVIPNSDLKLISCISECDQGGKTVDFRVRCLNWNKPIFVKVKLALQNAPFKGQTAEHMFTSDEEWCFPSFNLIFKKSKVDVKLTCEGKHILSQTDGSFTLDCEIFISGYHSSAIEESECTSSIYAEFIDAQENVESLCNDLCQLYNIYLPKLSDVTLQVGEVRFPSHRVVLAARSPVFSRMLEHDMVEKKSGIVKITDIEVTTLNTMLTYMYSAGLDIVPNYDKMIKLYSAADKYEISRLREKCAVFLSEALSVENVYDILILADMHADSRLKTLATDFIIAHTDVLLATDEWKGFIDTRADIASEVLHAITLNVLQHKKKCLKC